MRKQEFISKKNAIWKNAEKKHNCKIPEFIRTLIENKLGDPGDEQQEYLDSLEGQIDDDIKIFIQGINYGNNKNGKQIDQQEVNNKPIYQKPFERRLRLVTFVSDKVLNFNDFNNQSLKPTKRINWKKINGMWNKEYPFDIMTIPVMKAEYFRARAERAIQSEYFQRKHAELQKIWQPLIEQMIEQSKYFKTEIKKYFPDAEGIEDVIQAAKKLPAFKDIDVEDLTLMELLIMLKKNDNKTEDRH